jgi:hypothetical protein
MPAPGRYTPWADRPDALAAAAFQAMMRGDSDVADAGHELAASPAVLGSLASGRRPTHAVQVGG